MMKSQNNGLILYFRFPCKIRKKEGSSLIDEKPKLSISSKKMSLTYSKR